jgi:NAD+ diphosphatase
MDRLVEIPLCAGTHDRAALRRRDEAWLAQARQAASSRVIAVRSHADLLVAEGSRLGCLDLAGLPADAELTFLGIDEQGAAVFVCDLDALADAKSLVIPNEVSNPRPLSLPTGTDSSLDARNDQWTAGSDTGTLHVPAHAFQELRVAGGLLSAGDAALAVQAVAMVNWHRRHRFCGVCGGPAAAEEAGHSRRCANCGAQHFPRTDPAVIMLVAAGDRCVLSRRTGSATNRWTVLSGFVEPGETPEAAVVREVLEEVGVRVNTVRYLGSQPWPFPASLMLGYEAEAEFGELTVDEELEDARWFSRAEIMAAIQDGSLAFPPSVSISRQLIWTWLHE